MLKKPIINKYKNFYDCLDDLMSNAPSFIEPNAIKNHISFSRMEMDVEIEHIINGEKITSSFIHSPRGLPSEEVAIASLNLKRDYKRLTGHSLDLSKVVDNLLQPRNEDVYQFCEQTNAYPANYSFCNVPYTFEKSGHIENVVYYDTNSNHLSDYRHGVYIPVLETLQIDDYRDDFVLLNDLKLEKNRMYIIHCQADYKRGARRLDKIAQELLYTGQTSLKGRHLPYQYQNLVVYGDKVNLAYKMCLKNCLLQVMRVLSCEMKPAIVEEQYIALQEKLYEKDKALAIEMGLKQQSQILIGFLAQHDKVEYDAFNYELSFDETGISLQLNQGSHHDARKMKKDGRLTSILFIAMQNEKSYLRVKRADDEGHTPLYCNLDSVIALQEIPEEEANVGSLVGNVKRKTGTLSMYGFGRYALYNEDKKTFEAVAFGGDSRPVKTLPLTLDDFDKKNYEFYKDYASMRIAYTEQHNYGLELNYPTPKESKSNIHLITGVAGSGKTTHVRTHFKGKSVLTMMFNRAPCDKLNKGSFTFNQLIFDEAIKSPALTYSQVYKATLGRRKMSVNPMADNYIDFENMDEDAPYVSMILKSLLGYDILHIDEYQAVNDIDWRLADWLIKEYTKQGKQVYVSGDDYQHLTKVDTTRDFMTWQKFVSLYDCSIETYLTEYRSDKLIHEYIYKNNPAIKCGQLSQGNIDTVNSIEELEKTLGTARDVVFMARGRQQVAKLRDKIAVSQGLFDIPIMSALQSVSTEHDVVVLFNFSSKIVSEDDIMVDREIYLALSRCKHRLIFFNSHI